jgi:serine protease Do
MGCGPFGRIGTGAVIAGAIIGGFAWQMLTGAAALPSDQPQKRIVAAADGRYAVQADVDSDSTNTLALSGLEQQFQTVAKRVSPSVVAISAAIQSIDTEHTVRANELNPERLAALLDRTTRTVGTGFIISEDGYILTNEHVVGDAEQLWITTDDRKVYPAIVIGSDPRGDLAVLKIPAEHLQPVNFAPDANIHRGQWSIALGNPYGLAGEGEMAMAVGLVSATNRSLPKLASKENRLYFNLIQTTAEINPGNSGGPLFDLAGDVIGINTAVVLPQKNTFGIGFAMPITAHLLGEIEDLKQGKEVVYGYVGVTVATATPRERDNAGINQPIGVRIDSVESDSPASSRLKEADIITEIDGQPIADSDAFVRLVGTCSVDHPARFTVYRGSHELSLGVTPHKRMPPAVAVTRENQRLRWNGMLLGPVPAHWDVATAQKNSGLMVLALDNGKAKNAIPQGSIISAVAGKAIRTVAELQQVLNSTPSDQCTIELANARTVVAVDPTH